MRIVVSGIGVACSIGLNARSFALAMFAGRDGVGQVTRFDTGKLKNHRGYEILEDLARDQVDSGFLGHAEESFQLLGQYIPQEPAIWENIAIIQLRTSRFESRTRMRNRWVAEVGSRRSTGPVWRNWHRIFLRTEGTAKRATFPRSPFVTPLDAR